MLERSCPLCINCWAPTDLSPPPATTSVAHNAPWRGHPTWLAGMESYWQLFQQTLCLSSSQQLKVAFLQRSDQPPFTNHHAIRCQSTASQRGFPDVLEEVRSSSSCGHDHQNV